MNWLMRLLRRDSLERDLQREIDFHVAAAADDHERSGMSRHEAVRRARLELGGVEQVKEVTRDARGTRWLEDWWSDTRHALRAMRRAPAFTAAAVLTLALGIGGNTAVWNIMDALIRRPLPIPAADELHAIRRDGLEEGVYRLSHPLLVRMREAVPGGAELAAMSTIGLVYVVADRQPERVIAQLVSGNFFSVLQVGALRGRVFTAADDRTLGAHPVAVISESFWNRRLGRDPAVVGRTLRVNGVPVTIVGIAKSGFAGLTVGLEVDLFAPLSMQHELRYSSNASSSSNADPRKPWVPQNGISWLTAITRAQPDDIAPLVARLDAVFRADVAEAMADEDSVSRAYGMREHVVLEPLSRGFSFLRQQFGDPLRALMAGVGVILLIACANLAGLLLARGAARTHEMAVRVSLGARPGRLIRQTLTESLTLSLAGGAVGVAIAHWFTGVLLQLASAGSRAVPLDTTLDARVLGFAFAVTMAAGLLFGLAPALRAGRTNLHDSARGAGRVQGGTQRVPLGRLLVAGQIALSLLLVTAAGVFVQTFRNILNIDAGFERETLITARVDAYATRYARERVHALHDRLIAAAAAVPAVRSASVSVSALGSGSQRISSFTVPGRDLHPAESSAQENFVSPGYFQTTGIQILAGRGIDARDRKDAPQVAVLSEAAARKLFGTDSIVGRRFGYGHESNVEVVGLARDVRVNSLKETNPTVMIWKALAQVPDEYANSVEVRVAGDPRMVLSSLRAALERVDANLPIRDVAIADDVLRRSLLSERLVARLAGAFGILALLLAAIGLYGVVSYSTARRTNEMGVRLALGASPGALARLVLREALGTVVVGLGLGLALWIPVLGLTRTLLYGVSPHDPATMAVAAGVLVVVAVAAALLPARRAASIHPIEAIRSE